MVDNPLRVGIAKLIQSGESAFDKYMGGPKAIEEGGLREILEKNGCILVESKTAELTPEEAKQYGAWHRLGLASRHLADIVADQRKRGLFTIGLLANCNGLMGMLGGFQRSSPDWKPLRVGLVWVDAHGDINTPETSLSGMLGGMPVAVATGHCLARLRVKCGLEVALPTKYVVMVGVRDTDPLEQAIIDRSRIKHITVDEIRHLNPVISREMERLARITDLIYVHVDLDVLDPPEVLGHGLTVKNGPTSMELGAALEVMFEHPKAAGFGIASYPARDDPDGITLKVVYTLIEGVVKGVQNRD
ncbi:MAG: arginase family protein [Candidatus Heimdallarchaeota archaeon]